MQKYFAGKKWIILAAFVGIVPIVIWEAFERYLISVGKVMIDQNDETGLARLVKERPRLANSLLEETFKADKKDLYTVLLANKANVEKAVLTTKWGTYPLMLHFADSEDVFWVSTAFKYGANPNAQWRNKTSPLSGALHGKRPENALAVIDAGADVNGRVSDRSFFDVAMTERQFEPAYVLLQKGANPNAKTQKLKSGIECIVECYIPLPNYSKEKNEEVLSRDYFQSALADPYFQKIVTWYREHDLDILNATHTDPSGRTPGVWIIPSFQSNETPTPAK